MTAKRLLPGRQHHVSHVLNNIRSPAMRHPVHNWLSYWRRRQRINAQNRIVIPWHVHGVSQTDPSVPDGGQP